ncbi:MAG: ATP-dependent Clp endopeptidase proteolytic subunit ClpP [Chroococcidiopsidaceae cyanobacterium CP_BM_RX_35]|nr:ATP-dependent Clp endopeptidase proteolytic subunit ClpP [Chroococcidiopsidaceae cyanobacterium CP_BM_RX_35]
MSREYQAIVPTVIQPSGIGERAFDIYSRLLTDRIVFLGTEVRDETANLIVAQLLFLEAEDTEKDVHLYINSPGGSITAGMGIYDTINHLHANVCTICVGMAASMGAFLLASGTKGKRFALPNARIMLHQPSGGAQGPASDIEVVAKEILYLKKSITRILAHNTGQSEERIEFDCDRDFFMSAADAQAYGLIDGIIEKKALPRTQEFRHEINGHREVK